MQYRSGDLLTRIVADIETLENFYLRVVIPPLAAVLVTILGCLILGSFDVWLAVALLLFIILTGVILPLASRWLSRQHAAELIATRAELNASLVDEVQGIADLLAYGQEDAYQARALPRASNSTGCRSGWRRSAAWATVWRRSSPAWPRSPCCSWRFRWSPPARSTASSWRCCR